MLDTMSKNVLEVYQKASEVLNGKLYYVKHADHYVLMVDDYLIQNSVSVGNYGVSITGISISVPFQSTGSFILKPKKRTGVSDLFGYDGLFLEKEITNCQLYTSDKMIGKIVSCILNDFEFKAQFERLSNECMITLEENCLSVIYFAGAFHQPKISVELIKKLYEVIQETKKAFIYYQKRN